MWSITLRTDSRWSQRLTVCLWHVTFSSHYTSREEVLRTSCRSILNNASAPHPPLKKKKQAFWLSSASSMKSMNHCHCKINNMVKASPCNKLQVSKIKLSFQPNLWFSFFRLWHSPSFVLWWNIFHPGNIHSLFNYLTTSPNEQIPV